MLRFILHITILVSVLFPREVMLFQHFCGGKLIHSELFEKTVTSCCQFSDGECDRCADEEIILSIDEFQTPQTLTVTSFPSPVTIVEHNNTQQDFHFNRFEQTLFASTCEPPVSSGKHRSILFQTFLL
jgi:hypothetical protein